MAHSRQLHEWADRFAILGDPSRLCLLLLIHRDGPIPVGDLSEASGLKPTTVSHALRVMRMQGVVGDARVGRSKLYRLIDDVTATLLDTLPAVDRPSTLLENGP
ncbi:MAG: metalloregulator ArsR/SmtB family transcription factor [Pseudonocardia sp.]|nr:metalloregulator ArsR/SmtB family transcription factor [Pseudonocardia sp.]